MKKHLLLLFVLIAVGVTSVNAQLTSYSRGIDLTKKVNEYSINIPNLSTFCCNPWVTSYDGTTLKLRIPTCCFLEQIRQPLDGMFKMSFTLVGRSSGSIDILFSSGEVSALKRKGIQHENCYMGW